MTYRGKRYDEKERYGNRPTSRKTSRREDCDQKVSRNDRGRSRIVDAQQDCLPRKVMGIHGPKGKRKRGKDKIHKKTDLFTRWAVGVSLSTIW